MKNIKKSQEIAIQLVELGHELPVSISVLMPYLPANPYLVIRELADMNVVANSELYSGPLPFTAAIQLESMGITSRSKLCDEIRSGRLDLSRFNHVGPKKWTAIMKWAKIDPLAEKLMTIRLKLPVRVVADLREMKERADDALKHPTIQCLIEGVLDSVQDKTEWRSLLKGKIKTYVDSVRNDRGQSV